MLPLLGPSSTDGKPVTMRHKGTSCTASMGTWWNLQIPTRHNVPWLAAQHRQTMSKQGRQLSDVSYRSSADISHTNLSRS